ncbi:MAG: hypothetical protein ABJL72_06380 [Roseobacter sp.]
MPRRLQQGWRALKKQWDEDEADWSFWVEWYEAILNGTPLPWELTHRIALEVTDEEWDAGQVVVAKRIEKIRADWLTSSLPQVNEVFEMEDGRYEIRGTIADTSKLMTSVLDRVSFALDTAVQSNMCDLNEMSLACKILRQAILVGDDDANTVEQFFRRASDLIKAGVASGKYAEDDETSFLTYTLDETALQLRGDHPEVAQAVATRLATQVGELEATQKIKAAELIHDLSAGSGPRLATEFELSSEVIQDGSSAQASADALKESGNNAGKISILERAKNAEGSGPMAMTKMGIRANQLVEFVTSLISGGS